MELLRSHIAFRYLWLMLALHIFNCSVDSPDAQPDGQAEDLSINDMESIVEVIAEQVLGIENAIPEHDEPDEHGLSLKKTIDLFRVPVLSQFMLAQHAYGVTTPDHATEGWAGLPRREPSAPPPKA